MLNAKTLMLAVLLSLVLPFWMNGQTPKERVYVWDFVDNNGQQTELTDRITSEFEEALIQAKCYQVVERRNVDKLLAHIKNEKAIAELDDLSKKSQGEVKKITNAQIVVFGKVDDDVASGEYKITVTFQHFDSSKEVKSIRIKRGRILDIESREEAMNKLVKEICNNTSPPPPPDNGIELITVGSRKKGAITEGQHKEYKFTGVANVALRFTFQKENTPRYTSRYIAEI